MRPSCSVCCLYIRCLEVVLNKIWVPAKIMRSNHRLENPGCTSVGPEMDLGLFLITYSSLK